MSAQPQQRHPDSSGESARSPTLAPAPEPLPAPAWLEALYPLVNLGQVLFVALWTTVCGLLSFALGLLTFRKDPLLVLARRLWAPPILKVLGARVVVEPLPEVDWSKPHIFVMNHQSMVDIPCAFHALPVNLRFVAKHTLKRAPVVGWYMWFTGMIFVNRKDRAQAVRSLKEAGARIREGANILVYPEGTRSDDGAVLPFKKGPFVLAIEAGVPLIPVAIDGSGAVQPPGGLRFRPGLVRIKVGEPIHIDPSGEDRDILLRRTRDAIIRLHREIGGKGGDDQAIAQAGVEGRSPTSDDDR